MTGDLKKDTDKKTMNSVDSKNNKGNIDKSPESGSSRISGIISNFKKFNISEDLDSEKLSDNDKKSETKTQDNPKNSPKQKSSKNSDKEKTPPEHKDGEDDTFHIPGLSERNFVNLIKNKRDRIIKVAALLIGGLLILYGLVIISASVTKVADNVIFGEEATLAAFLMLLGVLIIVAAFAQRILDKTFLSEINTELEVTEERSKSDANSKKGKDENANKVDNDNKDNIVGENKR